MNIVKVDTQAYEKYLLHHGGVGDIDRQNFQENAELICAGSTEAVVQFHRQKHFDFKYRVPIVFIKF